MDSALDRAQKGLSLVDIRVTSSNCWVHEDYEPRGELGDELSYQNKRVIGGWLVLELETEGGEVFYMLRVKVEMGIRFAETSKLENEKKLDDDEKADQEAVAAAQIEVNYHVDYMMTNNDLKGDNEALKAFAEKNVIHHVWAFWREAVDSQINKMRLPKLILPMLPRIN